MRKTQSIGQDIEGWNMVNEVQIPGNEFGPKMAFLDTLTVDDECTTLYYARVVT